LFKGIEYKFTFDPKKSSYANGILTIVNEGGFCVEIEYGNEVSQPTRYYKGQWQGPIQPKNEKEAK
jgi:hypothetical protein